MPAAADRPLSDFARGAALLALAARAEGVSREGYDRAVDSGELVLAHAPRGAIHALAPGAAVLLGRALLARDDGELAVQLGRQVQELVAERGFSPGAALAEVAAAVRAALAGGAALDKDALHDALRERLPAELLPWCRGCGSHHVAPMLWRYATVEAGARLDARRRYRLGGPAPSPSAPPPAEAVRHFLRLYGPAAPADFAEWAGLAPPHARRLWAEVAGELVEEAAAGRRAWVLREDAEALGAPPPASGVRLLPPGDPFLQKPNRALLAPEPEVRKRLFRPVSSPGAVLQDGELVGLWRGKVTRRRLEVTVEELAPLTRSEVEAEARRLAPLRAAEEAVVAFA